MFTSASLLSILKIMIFSSVFFVWVVRYQNIIEEFKTFQYPNWLRDLVGILKISFVILMLTDDPAQVMVGASGIALLMIGALVTHLKVKNPAQKMIPAITLLILSSIILFSSI
jgi:hypothetical protein